MRKKPEILILLGVIVILLGIIAFSVFPFSSDSKGESTYTPPWTDETLGEIEITSNVVGHVLNLLGAKELHNIPLTSKTPKIEILVDDQTFNSEIKKGNIITSLGTTGEKDIKISMTRRNVIDIINSTMPSEVITAAINDGSMNLELEASKTTLFTKGYLSLYSKFTGEEIDLTEK